ncbi:MAG: ATP-dependent helicase [Bryobacterales bacterium]|nr:ATP-dependent helicase [Bryobacterales bacterium]
MFEGPAGTGKTTRLLAAAREYLEQRPLDVEQRVLALTKYHGSRRRMDIKLRDRDEGVGNALDCVTVDSFARSLVVRWRSLVNDIGFHPIEGDFASITLAAGVLLQRHNVARWVARRYPLVVVDEMQDCKGGEVALLKGLEPHVRLLCGADAFQDLSGDKDNEAIFWASKVGEVVALTQVFRTQTIGLLAAAQAIRNGSAVSSDSKPGFEVVPAAAAAQGGAVVCWRVRSWAPRGPIALISATARGTSPFSDQVIDWACTNASTAKNGATAGPYPMEWESSDDEAQQDILEVLDLRNDPTTEICCTDLAAQADKHGVHDLRDWALRQQFVRGLSAVTVSDVVREVGDIVRRRRAFGPHRAWRQRAMTIHQAKNREFESVVVLWPLKIAGNLELKRRLLYNAVTRARGRAVVIVQDPKRSAMTEKLFAGGT